MSDLDGSADYTPSINENVTPHPRHRDQRHLHPSSPAWAPTALTEHDSPEESVHLLRAELDACKNEIDRLRRDNALLQRENESLRRALTFPSF